jgi:hypothetical protein
MAGVLIGSRYNGTERLSLAVVAIGRSGTDKARNPGAGRRGGNLRGGLNVGHVRSSKRNSLSIHKQVAGQTDIWFLCI